MKLAVLSLVYLFGVSAYAGFDRFEGNWKSGCHLKNNRQVMGHLEISKKEFRESWDFFSDETCQTPTVSLIVVLDVRRISSYLWDPRMIEIDSELSGTWMAVRNPELVENFNAAKFCGHTDWHLNQFIDLTSAEFCGLPSKGTRNYSIMGVDYYRLYLGKVTDELTGKSPETRPKSFDLKVPFLREN